MFVTRAGPRLRAHATHKRGRRKMQQDPLHFKPTDCIADDLYSEILSVKPAEVSHAYDFKWEYLCSELLSKLPRNGVSSDTRQAAAIDKMLDSESVCADINLNGYYLRGFGYTGEWYNTVLTKASNIVADVLGPVDFEIFKSARFTNGASTSSRRRNGDPYYKYSKLNGPVHCTPACAKYAYALRELTPLWRQYGADITIVPGNRITTVPKKTDIDRCIAMEPDVNMALQLCIGKDIRSKLLRSTGIDLRDQTVNQRLAELGSLNGNLSTIDLSSASDTISTRLVRDLVPIEWCTLLEDLRSPLGVLPDGTEVHWEKFSSMGNGYTFELETLIFYALSRAAIEVESNSQVKKVNLGNSCQMSKLAVYGDDIICPSEYADVVILALKGSGFTTNRDKTFTTGPFRESCGKHYYLGVDVTPFYIRKPIDDVPRRIWFLNSIRKWSASSCGICDPSVWKLWRKLSKTIPKRLKGGKDIDSVSALVTPGKPRDRLVSVFKDKRPTGPIGVLRWFQNNQSTYTNWYRHTRGIPSSLISWSKLSEQYILDDVSDTPQGTIIVPSPTLYRYKPNDVPWHDIPLFSEEVEDIIV